MMRSDTSRMLLALTAAYPKKALLAFWSDLRKLDKKEFEALVVGYTSKIDELFSPPRPPRHGTPPEQSTVPDDTPTARIEHMLVQQGALSESRAMDQLKKQLVQQGVDRSKIPPSRGRQLADWLSALFRTVPASQVMHAALQISARPPQ